MALQGACGGRGGRRPPGQAQPRQGFGGDERVGVEERHPLHQVAQLAHVARPGVLPQPRLGVPAQALGGQPVARRIALQAVPGEPHDVLPPRPQGGQGEQQHRQPVVEVQAEAPVGRARLEVRRRGGDDLDIDRALTHRPQPADALLLESLQQFTLQQHGQRIDLIQEERAPGRRFKEPGLGALGIREGAGLEAEELGFEHGVRDGGAVDLQEGAARPRSAVVQEPRHQALAGAGLPGDEHRGDMGAADDVEGRQVADLGAQVSDGWGGPEEPVGGISQGGGARLRHGALLSRTVSVGTGCGDTRCPQGTICKWSQSSAAGAGGASEMSRHGCMPGSPGLMAYRLH